VSAEIDHVRPVIRDIGWQLFLPFWGLLFAITGLASTVSLYRRRIYPWVLQ